MPPVGLIEQLNTYGPWAVVVVLFGAISWLAKAYINARDANETSLTTNNRELTSLVKQQIEINTELKATMQNVGKALESIDKRVEDVEKKL